MDAGTLKALVDTELGRLSDLRVLGHVRKMLVEPKAVLRGWDYGEIGQKFPCWEVLNHAASNTGIAYCEYGFGPRCPWGLVWIGDDESHRTIGMDSSWFASFWDAYFESLAATELDIWRVFKENGAFPRKPLTQEDSWAASWERAEDYRKKDPSSRYDVDHGIAARG